MSGFGVEGTWVRGARRPAGQGPKATRPPASSRNRAASGQAKAKWMRMRAAFSTIRAPILSSLCLRVAHSGPSERHPAIAGSLSAWSFSAPRDARGVQGRTCHGFRQRTVSSHVIALSIYGTIYGINESVQYLQQSVKRYEPYSYYDVGLSSIADDPSLLPPSPESST